ncbi:MAG: CarD family transcriptional regulator [Alphaproteobacteria bacterium]
MAMKKITITTANAEPQTFSFATGEHVVYPAHGVGRIIGKDIQEVAGCELEVVSISFESERMTLRVPLAKTNSSGLRPLSSKEQMNKALIKLKGRPRVRRARWSQRAQEYEAKINSGDPVSIAEVVRDLYREEGVTEQSYSERQIYKTATDRLARELAAIDETDELAAAEKLEELLQKKAA